MLSHSRRKQSHDRHQSKSFVPNVEELPIQNATFDVGFVGNDAHKRRGALISKRRCTGVVSNIGFQACGSAPKLLESKAHQRETEESARYVCPLSPFVVCSEEVSGTPVDEDTARSGDMDAGVRPVGNVIVLYRRMANNS